MCRRSLLNIEQQFITAYKVGQENIGDKERNQKKDEPLQALLPDLFSIPFLLVEPDLLSAVTFDPLFYFPEDHFHKDRLWAYPSTEDPSKSNCKQNHKDHPY